LRSCEARVWPSPKNPFRDVVQLVRPLRGVALFAKNGSTGSVDFWRICLSLHEIDFWEPIDSHALMRGPVSLHCTRMQDDAVSAKGRRAVKSVQAGRARVWHP
jgi:hypothetical protein